jgi:hypothetical protein
VDIVSETATHHALPVHRNRGLFSICFGGNAYDFSHDLSTFVYARPGGQHDLYFLSQK